ncbi:MAG: sulfite exporter TauE/SafE family protein [Synergistaceae bacterium]|jgi:sulfite exporter TauE/SafE/copper chaperone CopZ|nr:sulfite exporter TauE/SafE family protein [Synergistaceae bacterium]
MAKNFRTESLRVAGMTCAGCEGRIERKLRGAEGVRDVKASFAEGSVRVVYDTDATDTGAIGKLIEELDYRVVGDERRESPVFGVLKTLWIAIALYELYAILDRFGLLDIFYAFPEAEAGMGYGMLFLVGALTSVHCVAMCGGINLSQSLPPVPRALAEMREERKNEEERKNQKIRFGALRSGFLYNLGRVASYTLAGGLAGALGSVVSISEGARGWVQIAAGGFMVVMGLNMLNVFTWLRRLTPHMPKFFAEKIHGAKGSRTPLYVGLLNGLMPCGPLQAMQLYALSSGSFAKGALSMFLFGMGTLPLMFGLSALSSLLSKKFAHGKFASGMMSAGAAAVVVFGLAMFGNGLSLSGVSASVPMFAQNTQKNPSGALARVEGDVQTVRTELAPGRYAPITVQAGVPVRWTIHAEPGTLNGCNNRIVIPEYGRMQKKLELGDNVIEFTPARSGAFLYTCWMGMIRGRITVVDEIGGAEGVEAAAAKIAEADDSALAAELPPDLFPNFDAVSGEPDPFDVLDGPDGLDSLDDPGEAESAARPAQPRCVCCGTPKAR